MVYYIKLVFFNNREYNEAHRHLLKVIRFLMFTMNCHVPYKGNAILSIAHLINRIPLGTLNFKVL